MKKYYVGFLLLLAVCAAAVVYTLSQAAAAKTDKATDQAVESIATKLDTYISDKGSPPTTLAAAGIKDAPTTVQYTRVSDSQYKVCLNYQTASSGFDAGWTSLLSGGITGGSQQPQGSSGNSYFDSSVETKHKKGQNCQTVNPYSFNSAPIQTNSYGSLPPSGPSDCGQTSHPVNGSATVTAIDASAKTITFSPDNQFIFDQDGKDVKVTSKTYSANTLFCGPDLKKADVNAVKAGQTVVISLSSASDPNLAEVDAY